MDKANDFDTDSHEISCRTINTIIKYVQQQGKDADALIEGLPFDEKYLTDTNNWISRQLTDEIYRRLKIMFDDDEITYKVGLASEKLRTLGFLDYITRLMGDPGFIIKKTPILNRYFNRTEEIEVLEYAASRATVKYYSKPGYVMNADDCHYTKGILAALPHIWGVGSAKIWEETCCVPIDKKGRINGKSYTVSDDGYVSEHDGRQIKTKTGEGKVLGKLNSDGTFKLNDTIYGAKCCLYHISWSAIKMCFKRILYEFFKKPKILLETLEEMQRENDIIQQKYEELYQHNIKLQGYYLDTVNAFIRAIDAKDHYTQNHSLNVARVAESIAEELKLSAKKTGTIRRACKLHDIGKIGVRESILLKPGKLTDEEWKEIKKHPVLGAEIIKPLTFLSDVAVLIIEDHERWDGRGYPNGLKGEEIDIGARIIMVADAYDAMISGRPYKKALTKQEVISELKDNAGTQFDPKVVEAFLKILIE